MEKEIRRPTTPLNAIKQYCKKRCAGNLKGWRACTDENCPLLYFRLGKNPYRKKRKFTKKQKEELALRMKKARDCRN